MAVISNKVSTPADIPPITYGIWIRDTGWLRDHSGRTFADPRYAYAKEALRLWRTAYYAEAQIRLIDESMIGLQEVFLEHQRFVYNSRPKKFSLKYLLRRLTHGILG
jgi:hypothetical protein